MARHEDLTYCSITWEDKQTGIELRITNSDRKEVMNALIDGLYDIATEATPIETYPCRWSSLLDGSLGKVAYHPNDTPKIAFQIARVPGEQQKYWVIAVKSDDTAWNAHLKTVLEAYAKRIIIK